MKTEQPNQSVAVFLQTVSVAVAQLKQRLQQDYQRAYPELREIINVVVDEEESRAWRLTPFPHLLFPDLVEAHIANLILRSRASKHKKPFATHRYREIEVYQPIHAPCG